MITFKSVKQIISRKAEELQKICTIMNIMNTQQQPPTFYSMHK